MVRTHSIISNIGQRLADVRLRIADAAPDSGCEITAVAVCKRQSDDAIVEAWQAGQRDFGENYVQEIIGRNERIASCSDMIWHLIGPLQSNKTASAAKLCSWIHSLDRIKIAHRLSQARIDRGAGPINACVQINLSSEASKAGIDADEAADFCAEASQLEGIRLRGLMCIPEATGSADLLRERYSSLRELCASINATRNLQLDTLSMGMSADYELAISQGATMIRIGTAIFGQRRN